MMLYSEIEAQKKHYVNRVGFSSRQALQTKERDIVSVRGIQNDQSL